MKRIFGQAKDKAPPPSLVDTTSRLTTRGDTCAAEALLCAEKFEPRRSWSAEYLLLSPSPHRLDEKLRKLDEQLVKHREVIKRTRPGPAQEAAKRRALNVRPASKHSVHFTCRL